MARLYSDWCIYCERTTTWVHHDMEPGKLDNCISCGKDIWAQHDAANKRFSKRGRR
jgi:DNA-binding sugar fermentation-stimulating protein